jgi:hypothetical protein
MPDSGGFRVWEDPGTKQSRVSSQARGLNRTSPTQVNWENSKLHILRDRCGRHKEIMSRKTQDVFLDEVAFFYQDVRGAVGTTGECRTLWETEVSSAEVGRWERMDLEWAGEKKRKGASRWVSFCRAPCCDQEFTVSSAKGQSGDPVQVY